MVCPFFEKCVHKTITENDNDSLFGLKIVYCTVWLQLDVHGIIYVLIITGVETFLAQVFSKSVPFQENPDIVY